MFGWYEPVTALATGITVVAAIAAPSHRPVITTIAASSPIIVTTWRRVPPTSCNRPNSATALADREHQGVEHGERAEDDHQTEQYVTDPCLRLGVGVLGRLHDLATTDVGARVIDLESSQRRPCRTCVATVVDEHERDDSCR